MAQKIETQNLATGPSRPIIGKIQANRQRQFILSLLSGIIPPVGLVLAIWLWLAKKLRRLAVMALVASLLFAGLYVWLYSHYVHSSPYSYTYHSLQSSTIYGGKPGTKMDFSKPAEFSLDPKLHAANFSVFNHQVVNGTHTELIGSLFAADSPLLNPQLASITVKSIGGTLNAGPKDKNYKNAASSISNFAQQILYPYTLSLGTAQSLKTANLSQNAWQFTISATNSHNQQVPKLQGQIVYVLGKNAIYYFGVTSTPDNWAHNSGIWQQIVNSIKVDQ